MGIRLSGSHDGATLVEHGVWSLRAHHTRWREVTLVGVKYRAETNCRYHNGVANDQTNCNIASYMRIRYNVHGFVRSGVRARVIRSTFVSYKLMTLVIGVGVILERSMSITHPSCDQLGRCGIRATIPCPAPSKRNKSLMSQWSTDLYRSAHRILVLRS